MSLITFSIYCIGYYLIHSLLATNFIKEQLDFRWYRILYNIIAIVTIIPIVMTLFKSCQNSMRVHWFVKLIGILFILFGIIIQRASFKSFSKSVFWGLRQEVDTDQNLVVKGLYASVRHPLYFGALMMIIGVIMILPNSYFLIFATISLTYIIIGSRLEENKLVVLYAEYKEYRKSVPGIIPYKKPMQFLLALV